MEDELQKLAEKHSAGEIIKHAGPYAKLVVPSSKEYPNSQFIRQWIAPFYQKIGGNTQDFIQTYAPLRKELSPDIINCLLVWLNWRSRSVGACLAAIEKMTDFTEHIGRLLLRSDVCFSGLEYAVALARFNSPKSRNFLKLYLDYYLDRPDLIFDQASVIAAVAYLDQINNSHELAQYTHKWENFCAQTETDLEIKIQFFNQRMNWIEIIINRLK